MQNILLSSVFLGRHPKPDSFLERKASKRTHYYFQRCEATFSYLRSEYLRCEATCLLFRKYGYYIGKLIRGINMNRKTLETDRLLLRRFDHNDLYDFYEMAKVPR